MADEKKKDAVQKPDKKHAKKAAVKAEASGKKKGNLFARMGKSIARFCKDFKGEIKKIVWPTGKSVLKSTGVVLVSILVIGAGVWIVDWILGQLVTLILSLAPEASASEAMFHLFTGMMG